MKEQIQKLITKYKGVVSECEKSIRGISAKDHDVRSVYDNEAEKRLRTKRIATNDFITDLETILKSEQK